MTSKQVIAVAVLAAVLMWSTVMTVLGHLAAVAALLPSLGLLVQQIISALGGAQVQQSPTPASDPAAVPPGLEGPSR
ncbi:hypothetical protein AB0N81_10730 [Streptomyces sp. NPDC093510]|uniref:hypothetical protein n=1 Tax=Streptomyces sp. NPDC093510 TaxID=3155199 RepID=UPI00343665BC